MKRKWAAILILALLISIGQGFLFPTTAAADEDLPTRDVVLILDNSKYVRGEKNPAVIARDEQPIAKLICQKLNENQDIKTNITLQVIGQSGAENSFPAEESTALEKAVDSVLGGSEEAPIYAALAEAAAHLDASEADIKCIVLLTAGVVTDDEAALNGVDLNQYRVYTIGLYLNLDGEQTEQSRDFLKDIANAGHFEYNDDNRNKPYEDCVPDFSITKMLVSSENVKAYIYPSDKRETKEDRRAYYENGEWTGGGKTEADALCFDHFEKGEEYYVEIKAAPEFSEENLYVTFCQGENPGSPEAMEVFKIPADMAKGTVTFAIPGDLSTGLIECEPVPGSVVALPGNKADDEAASQPDNTADDEAASQPDNTAGQDANQTGDATTDDEVLTVSQDEDEPNDNPTRDELNVNTQEKAIEHYRLNIGEGDPAEGETGIIELKDYQYDILVQTESEKQGNVYFPRSSYLGQRIEVRAEAKEGYAFEGWYDADGQKLSDAEQMSFLLEDNLTISAKFKAQQGTIFTKPAETETQPNKGSGQLISGVNNFVLIGIGIAVVLIAAVVITVAVVSSHKETETSAQIPTRDVNGYAGNTALNPSGIQAPNIRMEASPRPAPIQRRVPARKPILLVTGGSMKGKSFTLIPDKTMAVGKDSGMCEIVLGNDYRYVSRKHFTVTYDTESDMFFVTDLSKNGTFNADLHRLPYEKAVPVKPGSTLMLGDDQITIKLQ